MSYVCLISSRFLKIPAWENIWIFLKSSNLKPQLTTFSPWQYLRELDAEKILSLWRISVMSPLHNQITYTGHILKANEVQVIKLRKKSYKATKTKA